jgi:hypothetical protein
VSFFIAAFFAGNLTSFSIVQAVSAARIRWSMVGIAKPPRHKVPDQPAQAVVGALSTMMPGAKDWRGR